MFNNIAVFKLNNLFAGLYYCFNIVLVMVSIFLASIVSKLADGKQNRKRKPVPEWAKKVSYYYNTIHINFLYYKLLI